jgi:hypothetical protein
MITRLRAAFKQIYVLPGGHVGDRVKIDLSDGKFAMVASGRPRINSSSGDLTAAQESII